MNTADRPGEGGGAWAVDKVNALRVGQRLVAEVSASGDGRRAFVDITPIAAPADAQARREGWKRADRGRAFRLRHWEYDAERIAGFDYDVGAVLVRDATADDEGELGATLEAWGLRPGQFVYPWQTDDPR